MIHLHDYLMRAFVPTAGGFYFVFYLLDERKWPKPWRAGPQAFGIGTTIPFALALRFAPPVDIMTSKMFQFYAFAVALLHVEFLFTIAYWGTSCRCSMLPSHKPCLSFQSSKRSLIKPSCHRFLDQVSAQHGWAYDWLFRGVVRTCVSKHIPLASSACVL